MSGPGETDPPAGRDSPEPGASGPLSFPEGDAERWAHRRDPDLEPGAGAGGEPGPPSPPAKISQYGWIVGVVVVLLMTYIGLNTLRNAGSVTRGPEAGKRLAPFAVPLALSDLDGDANLATAAGQGQRGSRPACEVRGPRYFNVCQLGAASPLVLAFVATKERSCADQLDSFERVRSAFPGVTFAAVAAKTDRGGLRRLIRRRGWGFPIGYDRDGGAFTVYGVVDCPTVTFAYPGRITMQTTLKRLGDGQLRTIVARLVERSRRRGWRPPAPA